MKTAAQLDARIQELAALEPGWDSYRALKLTPEALATARRLAIEKLQLDPQLVPTVRGGVQIELVIEGLEVELEIEFDGKTMYLNAEDDVALKLWGVL